jgi:hypothetical protein
VGTIDNPVGGAAPWVTLHGLLTLDESRTRVQTNGATSLRAPGATGSMLARAREVEWAFGARWG